MFLLGFVNSTFEASRQVELVHLSLEIAHREVKEEEEKRDVKSSVVVVVEEKEKKRRNGVARVRRPSVEDLPPDLYMEPLLCALKSPVQVSLEQDDIDQEWSFWNLECHGDADTRRVAGAFAESGISTCVQHHPLESTHESRERDVTEAKASEEEAKGCEEGDEGFERILQHLQRIEGSVKDLKARVDDAKIRIEQSERDCSDEVVVVVAAAGAAAASPSLSSPVMEKMGGAVASPELPYSWNKKPNSGGGARSAAPEEPQEERELRYSPPLADSDVLSFRLWEQEPPKSKQQQRRSSRKSKEAQLDLETALDLVADEYAKSKDLKLPLPQSGLRHHRYRYYDDAATKSSTSAADLGSRRAEEYNNASPCSFTCGLSPTSLFSDDQEPFQMSVSIDDSMYFKMFSSGKASPRSVLSLKEDEVSRQSDHSCAYLYDGEESSDLESPATTSAAAAKAPFPTFTYNLGRDEIGETSSSDEDTSSETSTSLEFFLEAADSSPWLGRDAGATVLDASDLEFLLSPDMKTSLIKKKSPSPKPKTWVPYVKAGEVRSRCAAGCEVKGAMRQSGGDKVFVASLPKAKRSVNFAADLVKEIPPSPEPTFEKKKPAPPPPMTSINIPRKSKKQDQGASIMTTSRRCSPSSAGRRRQKVVEAVACSGKLFSKWPQKLKQFKVSKVSKVPSSSDDEDESATTSFGTSARRDAEQVRRILKGSQKRYSNFTVDEIMKEDFTKWR